MNIEPETDYRTGPTHEFWSGISMIAPLTAAVAALQSPCSHTIGIAALIVCPCAMALHFGAWLGFVRDTLDSNIRRADQTAQCISAVICCIALSPTPSELTLTASAALYSTYYTWAQEYTNDRRRWRLVVATLCTSFTPPMLRLGMWTHLAITCTTGASMTALFVMARTNQYSHGMFHVLSGALVCLLAAATCATATPGVGWTQRLPTEYT